MNGVRDLTIDIPVSGHDFTGNTRYEVILTVTDADGLQQSSSVTIWPDKVNLNVDSAPSGLTVTLDGISKTTPFVVDSLKGFQHALGAPDQVQGSTSYVFASWSDLGARTHTITTPDQAASYVATFTASSLANLVAAYSFDEGAGTMGAERLGQQQHRHARGGHVDRLGQDQRRAVVQRHLVARGRAQRSVPAAVHGDDAGGMGEPHHHHEQVARR